MVTTIRYETESCGRCGGGGRYSYCQMYGDTCFGCRGTGRALTKAGAKARAAVEAFKAEHFSLPVELVQPGMRVTCDGLKGGYGTVVEVRTSGGGRYLERREADGTEVWRDYVTHVFRLKNGQTLAYGRLPGTTVVRKPVGEEFDRLVAFARTLRGAVVVDSAASLEVR